MYCLWEKYSTPITVQYYVANHVSWVLRLIFWIREQIELMIVLLEQDLD